MATRTIAEAGLLAAGGALCGLPIAQLAVAAARTIAATEIARLEHVTIDAAAVAFGVAASLLWTVIVSGGLLWRRRRRERLAVAPHAAARVTGPTRLLRAIVVAQVTAALVVAIAAGLLVRSLLQLRAVDRGFATQDVAALELLLPDAQYSTPSSRERLYTRLVGRVSALPGVHSATGVHLKPGTGATGLSAPMLYEGQQPDDARRNPYASWEPILPSYFKTLGIPITRGRGFTDADDERAPLVAIVAESVARQFWPGEDPIGKRVRLSPTFPEAAVVGVAADARYRELTRTWLTVYFPARQSFFFSPGWLLVRTASPPAAALSAVRRAVVEEEPLIAVLSGDTVGALAAREVARPVAAVTMAMLFALTAIVVTVTGVYSVFSYDVALRARELAVHSSVGASPGQLLRMIVRRATVVAATGAATGLFVAGFLMRYLRTLLFEIQPVDAVTFASAATLLVLVVIVATLRPAARAAATDPVVLLRSE